MILISKPHKTSAEIINTYICWLQCKWVLCLETKPQIIFMWIYLHCLTAGVPRKPVTNYVSNIYHEYLHYIFSRKVNNDRFVFWEESKSSYLHIILRDQISLEAIFIQFRVLLLLIVLMLQSKAKWSPYTVNDLQNTGEFLLALYGKFASSFVCV